MNNNTKTNTEKHVNYYTMTKAMYQTNVANMTTNNKVFATFTDGKKVFEVKATNLVGFEDFFIINGIVKDSVIIGYRGKKDKNGKHQIFLAVRPAYSEKDRLHNFHEEITKVTETAIRSSLKKSIIENGLTYDMLRFNKTWSDIIVDKETSEEKVLQPSKAVLCALFSQLDIMVEDKNCDIEVRGCFAACLERMNKAIKAAKEKTDKDNRTLLEKENAKKTAETISDKAIEKFEDEHNYTGKKAV